MPNWVYNHLDVEGDAESISKLKEQVGKSYTSPFKPNGDLAYIVEDKPIESPFSFWNIIKPTDMEAYVLQPSFMNGKGEPKENKDSWYNWNIRNWGVKWDAADSEIYNVTDTSMTYTFQTPWGIPEPALINLSLQFPSLTFLLEYEEETGWGGIIRYEKGEDVELAEYNWKCPECDYMSGDIVWCEDCEFDVCPECGWQEADEPCEIHKVKENV